MLFDTFQYWVFFVIVATIFYSLPFRAGKLALLVASYAFYMWWDVRFIVLILASTIADFLLAILIESASGKQRKTLLIASLIVNLGLLGFFKYYNFFADSVAHILRLPANSLALRVILPVGISFYTFASLSYTIDVYRRKLRAVRNLVDYAFFIAFFPHLIAGPIIRASRFLPQIHSWRRPSASTIHMGLILVLVGLIKKVVFADRFAVVSDRYFANVAQNPGWLAAWSAATVFALQLYFDFSGYTDIARGCAKLLGFEFPINFARPYLAINAVEFWRRWHMTLTAWVRDYLFLPMVRKTRDPGRIFAALMLTMVLVGLWHGASWNFVVWGAYMGILIVAYRLSQRALADGAVGSFLGSRCMVPINVFVTLALFEAGIVVFRANSFGDGVAVVSEMFNWARGTGDNIFTTSLAALFFISFGLAVLEERHQLFERIATAAPHVQLAAYFVLLASLELFSVAGDQTPFLYFQF
jgi:D-alanyl-lipoteichoic acid acyltransferase DltB (MBOAT superfamily)